jgi:predicted alpha/beta superfamily hydrolase
MEAAGILAQVIELFMVTVPAAARAQSSTPHNISSELIRSAAVGDSFRVSISVPPNTCCGPNEVTSTERGDKRYPVIYVLDGDLIFPSVQQVVRFASVRFRAGGQELLWNRDLPEAIVVGIGYPAGQDPLRMRNRDMAPGAGAEAFRAFIRTELMPYLNSHFGGDPSDATLVGHSLGGLFALDVLFHEPSLFSRYYIGSPPPRQGPTSVGAMEEQYARDHRDLRARVFLFVGGEEGTPQDWYPPATNELLRKNSPVDLLRGLGARLAERKYPGLVLQTHVFETETHLTVVPASIARGLRFLFGKIQ